MRKIHIRHSSRRVDTDNETSVPAVLGIADRHTPGPKTVEHAALASRCEELKSTGIAVTGISHTQWPYCMARSLPERSHALVCTGGRGEVWQEGKWIPCTPGMIYFAPKEAPHAYRALKGEPWHHVWVIYQQHAPIPMPARSECRPCDLSPDALVYALQGLFTEVASGRSVSQRRLWAGLVNNYWTSLITSDAPRRRLDPLWRMVDQDLAHAWTLPELARLANVSDEHLRRLSLTEVGRSPLRQVTWLRLTRASALLQTTRLKLEEIAQSVGYGDAFSFSTAYRRWFGEPPSSGRSTMR